MQNKPLAETFRLIAQHGPDCFYKVDLAKGCDIALGIVEGQKWNRPQAPNGKGGSMTLADLEAYQPAMRTPIEGTYRGYRIKSMAPPSSGALTIIQILKMLERFPLGDASKGFGFGNVNTLNVMADAMRLAFADRAVWMADADFVPVPSKGLINDTYLATRGAGITRACDYCSPTCPHPQTARCFQATRARTKPPAWHRACVWRWPSPAPARRTAPRTSRWSTSGATWSRYTNTIESGYGIGVFAGYKKADGSVRNHGFLFNNELTDFNTTPSTNPWTNENGYNDVQADKRPRSSMAPTMLFSPEGKPILAYGSPGGATIINSVVNITINLIDHKMGLQAAVDAARISVASAGSNVTLENRFPTATVDAMRALGYSVSIGDVGSVQAVLIDQQTGKQFGARRRSP